MKTKPFNKLKVLTMSLIHVLDQLVGIKHSSKNKEADTRSKLRCHWGSFHIFSTFHILLYSRTRWNYRPIPCQFCRRQPSHLFFKVQFRSHHGALDSSFPFSHFLVPNVCIKYLGTGMLISFIIFSLLSLSLLHRLIISSVRSKCVIAFSCFTP